jgi:hypothetical protein
MDLLFAIRRPFVWLKRFKHRRGYGVHSPFAFKFITQVIYERLPYYSYSTLRDNEKSSSQKNIIPHYYEPLRLRRLLFRLANYVQPATIVSNNNFAASLYLKAGCRTAAYIYDDNIKNEHLRPIMLYLCDWLHPEEVQKAFNVNVDKLDSKSMLVIQGICYSSAMKRLWKRIMEDERTGISFDLYDVGIVFFDCTMNKQHYVVNF